MLINSCFYELRKIELEFPTLFSIELFDIVYYSKMLTDLAIEDCRMPERNIGSKSNGG